MSRFAITQCIENETIYNPTNGKILILSGSPPQNIENEGSYTQLWDTTDNKLRTVKGAVINSNDANKSVYLNRLSSLDDTTYVNIPNNDLVRIHQTSTGTDNDIILEKVNANVSKTYIISGDNTTFNSAYLETQNDRSTSTLSAKVGNRIGVTDYNFVVENDKFYMGPISEPSPIEADKVMGINSATNEISLLSLPSTGLTNIYDGDGTITDATRNVGGAGGTLNFNSFNSIVMDSTNVYLSSIGISRTANSVFINPGTGALSYGSPNNIYHDDGTLDADRTVSGSAGTYNLTFQDLKSFYLNTTGATTAVNIISSDQMELYGNTTLLGRVGAYTTQINGSSVILNDIPAGLKTNIVFYDTTTKELSYGNVASAVSNIYNANGTLTSSRTVSGGGSYNINFNNMPNMFMSAFNGISMNVSNASGNISITTAGNNSSIVISSTASGSSVSVSANTSSLGRTGAYTTNLYGQNLYLRDIVNASSANLLYYDNSTKLVTYAPVGSIATTNIYNSSGTLLANRNISGASSYSITFDNLTSFNANSSGTWSAYAPNGPLSLDSLSMSISTTTGLLKISSSGNNVQIESTNGDVSLQALATGSICTVSGDTTYLGSATGETYLEGDLYARQLVNASTGYNVFYNTSTKQLSYSVPSAAYPTIEGFMTIKNSDQTTSDTLAHVVTNWYSSSAGCFISNPSIFSDSTGLFTPVNTGYYAIKIVISYDVTNTCNVSVGLYDNIGGTFAQAIAMEQNTTSLKYKEVITLTGVVLLSAGASVALGYQSDDPGAVTIKGRISSSPTFSSGCIFSAIRVA